MRNDRTRATLTLLLALAACSGGGDEPGPPIGVAFEPAVLTASFDHGASLGMLYVDATLSRPPDGPAWVFIQQPAPVLDLLQSTVIPNGDGTVATLELKPSCALAPGSHSGAITFTLCRDAQCSGTYPLSGDTLPDAFTVSEGLRVTASVDGVAQPGYATICGVGGLGGAPFGASRDFGVVGGQTVTLVASEPVTWSSSIAGASCFPTVEPISVTATTWTAVVGNTEASFSNQDCGFLDVNATPVDYPYNWANVTVSVVSP